MPQIEIHEFCTGIILKGNSNEDWYSEGFSGNPMNSTLSAIPKAVADEIANSLFNVAESSASSEPAMIGREVQKITYQADQDGQSTIDSATNHPCELSREEWSVIAVVTSGDDEKGRSGSFYRYFLTQGLGKLDMLIRWWHSEGRPIFAPFDHQNVGQPHIFQPSQDSQGHNLINRGNFKIYYVWVKKQF